MFQMPDRSCKATCSAFLQKICRATKRLPHQPRETHRRHRRGAEELGEHGEEHELIQIIPPQETPLNWTPFVSGWHGGTDNTEPEPRAEPAGRQTHPTHHNTGTYHWILDGINQVNDVGATTQIFQNLNLAFYLLFLHWLK